MRSANRKNLKKRHLRERGFTLIEIMVVVTILAILIALVAPKMVGRTDQARRVSTKAQIKNIEGALQLYKLDNGVYPSTEQGLQALVDVPTVGAIPKHWKEGGYLSKIPDDAWDNPYVYLSPGSNGVYDLVSYGTDNEPGGEGDNADLESWNLN
ncbi:General secretion pathway protein G [hydrothermal vent metagenome]|uniref:Type II secretion system core protein G n=1 Tax=hydrothermal vent metagenome TaxID=652676 RepID=A0A3B1CQQ4_9ZZZZ